MKTWHIIVAFILAAVVFIAITAKRIIDNFEFKVVGYGLPKFSNWVLTIPIHIRFTNPGPISVPVERFEANIFMLQGDTWQQVSRIDQPLTIPKGISTQEIVTQVDFKGILNNNIVKTASALLSDKSLKIRSDVTMTVAGVTLPTQTSEDQIKIA